MKNHLSESSPTFHRLLALAGSVWISAHAFAAPGEMRDTLTDEQLAQKRGLSEQQDPMKKLPIATGEDPSKDLPKDLISQSDLLCFGGIATLVPKHAILQIPKNYEDRVKYITGTQIKGWSDFYAINRGWITTVEVTLDQAGGKVPIPEATGKQLAKSGNLVVAVFNGGPVSMLPAKVPAEKTETVSAKP
jgi:hypothetical protein